MGVSCTTPAAPQVRKGNPSSASLWLCLRRGHWPRSADVAFHPRAVHAVCRLGGNRCRPARPGMGADGRHHAARRSGPVDIVSRHMRHHGGRGLHRAQHPAHGAAGLDPAAAGARIRRRPRGDHADLRRLRPWPRHSAVGCRGGARGCGAGIPLARHARLVQCQPGHLRPARGVPSSLPAATAHRPDRHGAGGPRPRGTGCAARGRGRTPHYACLGPLHACVWSLQLLRPHCRAAPQHRARVRRADGARARARARRRRHRPRRARADGPHHLPELPSAACRRVAAGPGGSSPTCAGPAWPSTPACWRQPRCTAATTWST